MISEQLSQAKAQFEHDGFAVIRGFINPEEVEQIRREVDRYVAEVVPTLAAQEAFYEIKGDPTTLKQLPRISLHDDYFARLQQHQRLNDLAAALLGCPVISRDMQWFNKPPGVGKATPAHQDGFYDRIDPIEMVNMWLALDPTDEQNGCVRYIAGSHRRGLRPHARTKTLGFSQGVVDFGPDDEAKEVSICAQPGDILVHHGLTIHRADANPSNRPRRAISSIYFSTHVKYDRESTDQYRRHLANRLQREGKI